MGIAGLMVVVMTIIRPLHLTSSVMLSMLSRNYVYYKIHLTPCRKMPLGVYTQNEYSATKKTINPFDTKSD